MQIFIVNKCRYLEIFYNKNNFVVFKINLKFSKYFKFNTLNIQNLNENIYIVVLLMAHYIFATAFN